MFRVLPGGVVSAEKTAGTELDGHAAKPGEASSDVWCKAAAVKAHSAT